MEGMWSVAGASYGLFSKPQLQQAVIQHLAYAACQSGQAGAVREMHIAVYDVKALSLDLKEYNYSSLVFAMAATGLLLISFLVIHVGLNACIWADDQGEMFNKAAHFMGTMVVIRIFLKSVFCRDIYSACHSGTDLRIPKSFQT